MSLLQDMANKVLDRDPAIALLEFERQWVTIGQMRRLADEVNALIDASGADARAPIAIVPRNRPAMLTTILGLIGRERHIRMIHPYQSAAGLARDVARLKPAVTVAMAQDFADDLIATLREQRVAGIALDGMEAAAVPGCERSTAECDPPPPRAADRSPDQRHHRAAEAVPAALRLHLAGDGDPQPARGGRRARSPDSGAGAPVLAIRQFLGPLQHLDANAARYARRARRSIYRCRMPRLHGALPPRPAGYPSGWRADAARRRHPGRRVRIDQSGQRRLCATAAGDAGGLSKNATTSPSCRPTARPSSAVR